MKNPETFEGQYIGEPSAIPQAVLGIQRMFPGAAAHWAVYDRERNCYFGLTSAKDDAKTSLGEAVFRAIGTGSNVFELRQLAVEGVYRDTDRHERVHGVSDGYHTTEL